MDAGERAPVGEGDLEPALDLHLNPVVGLLLRPVAGELVDRWLRRVPVAAGVLVQVGRLARELAEGVAKGRRRLAGLDRAQQDPSIVDAAVGGGR